MPETVSEWLSFALSFIALAVIVYGWFTSGEKTIAKDLDSHKETSAKALTAIDAGLDAHERRIQALETELKHLPDREQAHRLELAMVELTGSMTALDERLSGRIEALSERLQPVQAIASRLQELELERKR
ncbi:DUF2730 family protein [Rhizobiales bacterium 3FA27D7]|jgi:chromosome segregation ATPase|uniref:DUF2730 family protein n=1 Tax=Mesorhizobium sp. 2RAF21 TaxID=3232995 RepID=UPI0014852833